MQLRPPSIGQCLATVQIARKLRLILVQAIHVNLQDIGATGLTEHVEPALDVAVLLDIVQVESLECLKLRPSLLCGGDTAARTELSTLGTPDQCKQ